MPKKRPHVGREVVEGVLKGHFKTGKTYKTGITALEELSLSDWVQSDLPDLLWPLLLVARAGDRGGFLMVQAQESVLTAIAPSDPNAAGEALDGRLTSLEAVTSQREAIREVLYSHELAHELFEPGVLSVLRMYGPALPGWWLFAEVPGRDDALDLPHSLTVLADAVVSIVSDRHLNAMVKAAPLAWLMQTGRLVMPAGLGDELIGYPTVRANVAKADAFILSAFLMTKSNVDGTVQSRRDNWAREFWNTNWRLTPCIPEERAEAVGIDDESDEGVPDEGQPQLEVDHVVVDEAPPADGTPPTAGDATDTGSWLTRVLQTYDSFLGEVLDPDAPIDLHSPARFEVLTGFLARGMRLAVALLRAPHMWSGEQAAPVMRALTEMKIVAKWMLEHAEDDWFARYQYYGRGKRKLHHEIVLELADSFGDDAPVELTALVENLDTVTGGDHASMFQDVSIESTFAGKTLRAMADDVDAADLYRFSFQVESGTTHGEWWAIEEFAMQRCLNPLHRFHLVPTFSPAYPPTPQFPAALVARFDDLVDLVRWALLGSLDDVEDEARPDAQQPPSDAETSDE